MSFGEAITTCFKKYVTFSGRARRSEYWYFFLFNTLVSVAASMIGVRIGFAMLPSLVSLALLLPGLGVSIRRLHDIGKSGWFVLFALIPLVGFILLLVWDCSDSQPGENQYGPNPKGVA